ncbi:hypothetical protein HAX54_016358, partial [Datura stramonium]|nr:hypothetical protein [Datura stramonium]
MEAMETNIALLTKKLAESEVKKVHAVEEALNDSQYGHGCPLLTRNSWLRMVVWGLTIGGEEEPRFMARVTSRYTMSRGDWQSEDYPVLAMSAGKSHPL